MKRNAIALILSLTGAFFAIVAPAQTDNTLYVKQFPGSDVATKVKNAQAACNPNTAVPCVLIIDPSLATTPAGTMPSLCAQCTLYDYRTPNSTFNLPGVTADGANGIKVSGTVNAGAVTPPAGAPVGASLAPYYCTPAVSTGVPNSQPINARCMGAVPDDGTDQTAHIQACINQATLNGTGSIGNAACYLPPGTYHVCNLIMPPSVKFFGDSNRTSYLTSTAGCTGDMVKDNGVSAVGIFISDITINGNNETGLYSALNLGCQHDSAHKAICSPGSITPWGSNGIVSDVVAINVPNGQCYKINGNVGTLRDMATNNCQGVITDGTYVKTDGLQVGAATGTSTGCAVDDQGNNDAYSGLLEVEAPSTGVTPYCGNHGVVTFDSPGVSANNAVATTIPSIYNCGAGTAQCTITNAQWVNSASLAMLTNWGVCGSTTYATSSPSDCHLGTQTQQAVPTQSNADNTNNPASTAFVHNYVSSVTIPAYTPTTAYTPICTGITNTGGAPTITGWYQVIGTEVFWGIMIVPVTNTSTTYGTSTCSTPTAPTKQSTSVNAADGSVSAGSIFPGGFISTSSLIYLPAWTSDTHTVIVSGSYM